jgi:hypothetical protein
MGEAGDKMRLCLIRFLGRFRLAAGGLPISSGGLTNDAGMLGSGPGACEDAGKFRLIASRNRFEKFSPL